MLGPIFFIPFPPHVFTAPQDYTILQPMKHSIDALQSQREHRESDGSARNGRNSGGYLDSLGNGNLP